MELALKRSNLGLQPLHISLGGSKGGNASGRKDGRGRGERAESWEVGGKERGKTLESLGRGGRVGDVISGEVGVELREGGERVAKEMKVIKGRERVGPEL